MEHRARLAGAIPQATEERFLTTLTRSAGLAAILTVVFLFALPRQGELKWDLLDDFTLAFAFAFVGHYVDVLLRRVPGIDAGGSRLIRVLGWFAGGLWCYVVGRWTLLAYGRDLALFPPLFAGGLFFLVLQLVLHRMRQASGRPSFFADR